MIRWVFAALVAWSASVRADGLVIAGGSARAIGRAGVGTVGDDGGGALLVNPAAMARRDGLRVQLGVAFADDTVEWQGALDAPRARDQAGSTVLPVLAAEGAIGDWIVGVGAMTQPASDRAFRAPGRIPATDYANAFDYRYAGLTGSLRRDTVTVGAARRFGDAVAVGLAVGGSRVAVSETRTLWAGFVDRKDVIGDPAHDVEVAVDAEGLSPSVVAGVLVAPPDSRVELGGSLAWAGRTRATGDVVASAASAAVSVQQTAASAALELPAPVTARLGARWLGERLIAELDGDLWVFPAAAETTSWQLSGVTVVDASGMRAGLGELPSRISERTHGAVRGAVDVELIAGFLWATAGYAYTAAGTSRARLSPTFGALPGHTAALGLEATAGDFTITLGWARTWSVDRSAAASLLGHDNPFGAGDAAIPAGTYNGSSNVIGITVDAAR